MGYRMAANIRKKMHFSATLHIYDINQVECQRFVDEIREFGPINIASSPKALTERSVILLSMVPMDQHAREVYLHPETGVIAAQRDPNRLALECSTLSVAETQAIGDEVRKAGVAHYVDTPVSGGVRGAESGTLSFFCGSANSLSGPKNGMTERITTVLSYMGDPARISFCGELGSGLTCKIVNNYIALSNLSVINEGLAFGLRYGVDIETLAKCIMGSSGDSWMIRNSPPAPGMIPTSPSSNGFRPSFSTRLCIKDMNLAIQAAKSVGIATNTGDAALANYVQAESDPRTTVGIPPTF